MTQIATTKVSLENDLGDISAQNPLPTNGDSVYEKDLDLTRSDVGNFSGSVSDFFNNLHTENTDTTTNNPKSITIHFQRTIESNLVAIGSSEGGDFSNVKIIGILSGGLETVLSDYSLDNTKRTSQPINIPQTYLNAIRLEFHTADTVSITNIYIQKTNTVTAFVNSPVKYGTNYGAPYLLNGTSEDMDVDGSTTPVDFVFTAEGLGRSVWNRSFIDLQDGTQDFQPDEFGALTSLTNGVEIIVEKDGIETILETRQTNMDISMTCYDFTAPYKAGAYIGRWTIAKDMGSPMTLFPDDKIICRINDNLSGLDVFRIRAKLSI